MFEGNNATRVARPTVSLLVPLVCALLATAASAAQPTNILVEHDTYHCADRTPAQAAPVPRPPPHPGNLANSMVPQRSICPAGQVPAPMAIDAPPPAPPLHGAELPASGNDRSTEATTGPSSRSPNGPEEQFGSDYFYGVRGRSTDESERVTALEGFMTNQRDYLGPGEPGAHSISQLWAIDELPNRRYSDIELGWINSSYFGSSEPTLFVYHFDDSEPSCYDGCGFVQTSNTVGSVAGYPISGAASLFTVGATHDYQIYEEGSSGKWYVAIDGDVVGYYPASAWTQVDPTLLTLEEAGGEVAAETADPTPQTTMGDGNAASSRQSADWTRIQDRAAGSVRWVNFNTLAENTPGAYSVGAGGSFIEGGPAGSNFRYGGPGWCDNRRPGYCVLPLAATGDPAGQTSTEASLTGNVNPNGLDTHYYFQYGTSTSLGSDAPAAPGNDAGGGTSLLQTNVDVVGLLPDTSYYYRVVAESAAGASYGTEQVLTTLPSAPTVVTGTASSDGQTSATLNATVNPNGGVVNSCLFEYGISTSYGESVQCSELPGLGMGPQSVVAPVSGLSPQTNYHFRVVAENSDGANHGSDGTFTTLPAPTIQEAPVASSPEASPGVAGPTPSSATSSPEPGVPAPVAAATVQVSSFSSAKAPPALRIIRVKIVSSGLVVGVDIAHAGAVTISGRGLKTTSRVLGAGGHRLEVSFTAAGRTALNHHRRLVARVSLRLGDEVTVVTIGVKRAARLAR